MRQPNSVLVYIFRYNNKWEVLLLKRIKDSEKNLDAFWQGVTGGLEDEESVEQAAVRELFEETSYFPVSVNNINFKYSFTMKKKWKDLFPKGTSCIYEHTCAVVVYGEEDPELSDEHDEFEWINVNDVTKKLKYKDNILAFNFCLSFLNDFNL